MSAAMWRREAPCDFRVEFSFKDWYCYGASDGQMYVLSLGRLTEYASQTC